MCGIAGFYNSQNLNEIDLKLMTDAIKHRGPDGEGFYFNKDKGVGLGHRRLSIIDLSSLANQPMYDKNGRYVIIYNGEIYNYIEIQNELKLLGHSFQSNSDTEVFLTAYVHWGKECYSKLNGMWACVIYDTVSNTIHFSRDRYGVKPLYYYFKNNTLVFASELKAILELSQKINIKFDLKGFVTAFSGIGMLEAAGNSLYESVFNLLPGHILDYDGKSIKSSRWWNPEEYIVQTKLNYSEQKQKLLELLNDACRLRLRSDVPVATSLSGGLDSSSIVCLINKNKNKYKSKFEYRTFVHTFPNELMDESKYAEEIIAYTGNPVTWVKQDDDDLVSTIDEFIYGFETLYPGIGVASKKIYESQKKSGFSVTLDGHGADELLGGYNEYLIYKIFLNLLKPKLLIQDIKQLKQQMGYSFKIKYLIKGILKQILPRDSKVFFKFRLKFVPCMKVLTPFARKFQPYYAQHLIPPKSVKGVNLNLYIDFHQKILPRLLQNFDVTSMANSVEVRMPFMDYRIVNFLFSLPIESKIANGFSKFILRDCLEGIVPDNVRLRKSKIGFHSPFSKWAVNLLKPWILEVLSHPSPSDVFIDRNKVRDFYENKFLRNPNDEKLASELWLMLNAIRLTQLVFKKHGIQFNI